MFSVFEDMLFCVYVKKFYLNSQYISYNYRSTYATKYRWHIRYATYGGAFVGRWVFNHSIFGYSFGRVYYFETCFNSQST